MNRTVLSPSRRQRILSSGASLALALGLALAALLALTGVPERASTRPLATNVSGDITVDTVWDLASSPYVLTDNVTILAGVRLTIEPGVIVMGGMYSGLYVRGQLQAAGTVTQGIMFTSQTNTGPYQWKGLYFQAGGTGVLQYATVRYAQSQAVWIENAPAPGVRIADTLITRSRGDGTDYGLYIKNSTVVLSDTEISYTGDNTASYAFYAAEGSIVTITHSAVHDNKGWGIWASPDSDLWLADTSITDNGFRPLQLDGDNLHYLRNLAITGNQPNYIYTGGTLAQPVTLTTAYQADGYVLADNLTAPAGITLTLAPGATVLGGMYSGLYVRGYLQAVGTPTQPITLTSEANTGPYQWKGLYFQAGGTGELQYATVRYAQSQAVWIENAPAPGVRIADTLITRSRGDGTDYGVYVKNSAVTLSDTEISYTGDNAASYGLYAAAGSVVTITHSTIRNNKGHGVGVAGGRVQLTCSTVSTNTENGILLSGSNTVFSTVGVSIYGNGGDGLNNATGVVVDAAYNWWGAADGPGGVGPGAGDEVTANVTYTPWLEWEHCPCDLSVTKRNAADFVVAGTLLTYTLAVFNAGPGEATAITLTDQLSADVTFVEYAASQAACAENGGAITCTLPMLAVGAQTALTLTVDIDPALRGVHTNTVTLAARQTDYQEANNRATASVTMTGAFDLSVQAEPAVFISAETPAVYTLTVKNAGPSAGLSVVLHDILPSGLNYADSNIIWENILPMRRADMGGNTACAEDAGVVRCELGTFYPTQMAFIRMSITPTMTANITHTVEISASEPDQNPDDNIITPVAMLNRVRLTEAAQTAWETTEAVTVTVMLAAPAGITITVPYTVTGAAQPGLDHDLFDGNVIIPIGQQTAQLVFHPISDRLMEPNETIVITLGAPGNAILDSPAQHIITLINIYQLFLPLVLR